MNDVNGSILPPAKVTDLVLRERSRANQTVTVAWTAPGADLDQGTGKLKHKHDKAATADILYDIYGSSYVVLIKRVAVSSHGVRV